MSDDLVALVLSCLRDVMLDDSERDPDSRLLGTAGIDSLVIEELLTACEEASGRTMAPELIIPQTFTSPRAIAQALAASGQQRGADQ
jgi:acyl carrier protein